MSPSGIDAAVAGAPGTSPVRVCRADDVRDGTARGVPEHGIFLVRHHGALHAWRDACPHYGDTPLPWRRDAYLSADGSRIVCAAHGAQFLPDTGVCTLGPCLGQALTRVPLTVTADGDIAFDPRALEDNMTMKNPALHKALVIGGGFSGMAAAMELRRHGVEVDLVELDADWRSYGAGISLGPPTMRAFRDLGILDAFFAEGAGSDGVELCLPDGTQIGQIPTPRLAGADIPGAGAIMRPALARLMAAATRRAGVDVRLGCTFTGLEQDADGVAVQFTDGSERRYDVVIGADGLYSRLRQQLFPDAPMPAYTGQGVWRAVLPRPPEIVRCRMWMGGWSKPGVNPVSDTLMYLFVTEHRAVNERLAPEQHVSRLRDLLAPFPNPTVQRIRDQIDDQAQVIYRPLESMLLPQPWFLGRVALIGDAVHATTPHLASGACIGIEDGLVIADELAKAGSVDAGLRAFQARRWERCRMVVENSGRLGDIEIANGDKAEHEQLMRTSMMALAQPI